MSGIKFGNGLSILDFLSKQGSQGPGTSMEGGRVLPVVIGVSLSLMILGSQLSQTKIPETLKVEKMEVITTQSSTTQQVKFTNVENISETSVATTSSTILNLTSKNFTVFPRNVRVTSSTDIFINSRSGIGAAF